MVKIPIESEATKIIKSYTGTNDYILYYKKMFRVNPYYVISKELAKYVIKNQNTNPTLMNKWVDIHAYSADRLAETLNKEKVPAQIFIHKVLAVKPREQIHVWGKMFEEETYYYSMFISTSAFVKTRQMPAISWAKYKKRPPKPHQVHAIETLVANPKFILADDMGLGKAVTVNTLAYTPYGKIPIGNIKIGDEVIGTDGKGHKVLGVFPQGVKDIHEITFNDGYKVKCCGEHLWTVYSNNNSENNNNRETKGVTLSVNEMLNKDNEIIIEGERRSYKCKTYYKASNGQSKWQIPIVKPIEFKNEYTLPIEPYLLGLCLGDGNIQKEQVNFTIHQDDYQELFNNIGHKLLTEDKRGYPKISIKFDNQLTELKINNTLSNNKFIPNVYKYSSIEDRISLLQGLMDTDGYCAKNEEGKSNFISTEYSTVSEQLANDVAEIVHSLGGIVRIRTKIGSYKKNGIKHECQKAYRLNIKMQGDINPFRLKRKYDLYSQPDKYKVGRYIKDIQPCGQDETICISVDSEDKLYVIDHAIVTHNTFSAIVAAKEIEAKRILVICPATLKLNWKREIIMMGEKETDVAVVDGNDWKYAKWIIVNYDILRNFHHMPQVGVRASDLPLTPIQIAKFDLVIIDEAHKLKDASSNRSKIVNNFIYNIPNRWLLTGTPISNKPIDYFNLLQICESPLADNWQRYVKDYCDGKRFTNRTTKKKYWVASGFSNLGDLHKYSKNLILRRLKNEIADLPEKIIRPIYLPITSTMLYDRYLEEYAEWLLDLKIKGEEPPPWAHLTRLIKIRQMLSLDKIPSTVELAQDLVDGGKKVVIFTCFTETLDYLMERFGKEAVRLDGSMTPTNRQKSVDAFQNSPKIKYFVSNILAGGVGITLTAAEVVIFNDLDWVPSNHVQAEDRVLRIGQKNNVSIFYPLIDETLDIDMFNALTMKKEVINTVMGDNEAAFNETMVQYVVERIKYGIENK